MWRAVLPLICVNLSVWHGGGTDFLWILLDYTCKQCSLSLYISLLCLIFLPHVIKCHKKAIKCQHSFFMIKMAFHRFLIETWLLLPASHRRGIWLSTDKQCMNLSSQGGTKFWLWTSFPFCLLDLSDETFLPLAGLLQLTWAPDEHRSVREVLCFRFFA